MDDIAKIKLLVGQENIPDTIVQFYLDLATEYVKGYCNISAIPLLLHNTLLQIAALLVRSNTSNGNGNVGGGIVGQVSSVNDGNQSVNFKVDSGDLSMATTDAIQSKYGTTLDQFRVLKGAEGHHHRSHRGLWW